MIPMIKKCEIEGFEYWAFERNGEWMPSQSLFHALLGIASPGMNMVIQSRMYLNATEFNEGVEMMGGVTVADLLEADGNKSDKIREQKDDPK
jgi:hypothetical protein